MSADPTLLEPGAKIGDTYEVVRPIGRGGMGEIWLARHLRLPGKQVAIKVLHTRAGGLSTDALARFKREADVATRIGHPNIVEVHDYNTLPSGAPYLVLEYLQGESLASRLRFGPLPLDEALPLIRQVGSALDKSHQLNVVHRDLKPDNIFLVPTPMGLQVKVLDFGISKIVDSSTLQTADEVLVGTPQYMSPEQATGQNKDVGPQTDIFALGCIVYEMLSGQPPFAADSVAKMVFRIAYEPHTPLEQLKPGLPDRVYTAVEGALQKDRARRYDTVAAFIAELTGQPVPRTLPPAHSSGEQSGVARPGMATPDSLAWGATAAPTPVAPLAAGQLAPTVPPLRPAAAPTAQARTLVLGPAVAVGGLGLIALAAAGLWLLRPAPPAIDVPRTVSRPVAVAAPPAPVTGAVAAVEPDAGGAALAPRPLPERAAVAGKKISAPDLEVLTEMQQRLDAHSPLERIAQLVRSLQSEAGLQRGYVIVGTAACREQDLGAARSYLNRLTDRAAKQRLFTECKRSGTELFE